MSEPNFSALRQHLEAQAQPPRFAEIQARRLRRTQRWAMAGIAGATVIAIAGTAFAVGSLRDHSSVPQPASTSSPTVTPTPSTGATGQPSDSTLPGDNPPGLQSIVDMPVVAPSGVLYTAVGPGPCAANCTADPVLMRSTDTGSSWHAVGPFHGGDLVAGSGTQLWTIDAALHGSPDGGRTWQQWVLPRSPYAWKIPHPSAAGDTVWFAQGAQVMVESGGKKPVNAAKLPATGVVVASLTALDRNRAIVQATNESTLKGGWFRTTDRGAHWTAFPDPCADTRFPASASDTLAAAPGALWAACAGLPGAGQQLKELVVSTDGGHTWQRRGTMESSGYGTAITPFSATVAWRTGNRSDIHRTANGTRWTDVAKAGDNDPDVKGFAAVNATTAVYIGLHADGTQHLAYVTRDGGKTWTTHSVPGS